MKKPLKNIKAGCHQLKRQVEALRRSKLSAEKVVDLGEYRSSRDVSLAPTIFVVDDDEIVREGIKRILDTCHCNVVLAEDGMALAKALEQSRADLFILDINLPWVDGFELCSLLKSNDSYKHVPLIILSGNSKKEDFEKGFAAGCTHYIAKPFEVDHLLDVVESCLGASRVLQE